ncbi:hypothetical protein [Marisediminicola sp. LYQ134]|uniref:hypothetical protein n=1 Tax=Marisediminicola sp. LYQ134 TaxID=3391061 RepID=UPI0039833FED
MPRDFEIPVVGSTLGAAAPLIVAALENLQTVPTAGELSTTIDAIVETALEGFSGGGLVIIEHGANASEPRLDSTGETFTAPALWVGTVAPGNRAPGDFYFTATSAPVAVLVWSETVPIDGALGSTETGGLAWNVVGTGYTGTKTGGTIKFASGTSSVGIIYVNDGQANVVYRAKITTKGASNQAGIVARFVDFSNHVAINRVSSTDGTYRIVKRIANTYTTVATLTGHLMADGDTFEITTLADGTFIVNLNGAEVYSGNIPEYATATARGVFCGASAAVAEMAYDDLSSTTVI